MKQGREIALLGGASRKIVLVIWVFALLGCVGRRDQILPSTYGAKAAAVIDRAEKAFKKGKFQLALAYYGHVREHFPFSRHAVVAELRSADVQLASNLYNEAAEAYQLFEKLHPLHPKVQSGYVSFKICQARVKQIPQEWFLSPPAAQQDPKLAEIALAQLGRFLDERSKGRKRGDYLEKARKMREEVLQKVLGHEISVAQFYLARGRPRGAKFRMERLLSRYSAAVLGAEPLLYLGKAHLKMLEFEKSRATFEKIVRDFPSDQPMVKKARLFLDFLRGKIN